MSRKPSKSKKSVAGDVVTVFRGRVITKSDVALFKKIISEHREKGRTFISRQICAEIGWTQQNGVLKEGVCRMLLLRLEKEGCLALPPRKRTPPPTHLRFQKQSPPFAGSRAVVCGELTSPPHGITITQVRGTQMETVFNGLIAEFASGSSHMCGEHRKYLALLDGRPVACVGVSSAPRYTAGRGAYTGEHADALKRDVNKVVKITSFIVPPWINMGGLREYILDSLPAAVNDDWIRAYNHPVSAIEVYLQPDEDPGPYRAAGWLYIGKTSGRTPGRKAVRLSKDVYARIICAVRPGEVLIP